MVEKQGDRVAGLEEAEKVKCEGEMPPDILTAEGQ